MLFSDSMTTEHRRAPRRDVVEIRRVGGWGSVSYHHVLSCGHIEKRPRASTAPKLACVWCLRAEEAKTTMAALTVAPQRKLSIDDDELATMETEAQMIKASLSSQFGVPADAVDVVMADDGGILRIRYATIFLSEKDLRRITGQQQGG